MRISDWSSDVCSSDLLGARAGIYSKEQTLDALAAIAAGLDLRKGRNWRPLEDTTYDPIIAARRPKPWTSWQRSEDYYNEGLLIRSEEHTSELQSLMRISYAVFCLKKKNNTYNNQYN